MPDPRRCLRLLWIVTIVAVAGVDLFVRFVVDFRLARVLWVEAALFVTAGWVLLRLAPHDPGRAWERWVHLVLVAGFMLGGLRAGLWAAGLPVAWANAIVLAAGAVAAGAAWLRGRRARES